MQLISESNIDGEFSGWDGDAVFELANGQKWQQAEYKYCYRYKYRPKARVWQGSGGYFLQVEGMSQMICVRRCY